MKHTLAAVAILALLVGLPGCITMQDSNEVAQQQEDMLLLKEDLNRAKGKLETLEMEYERLVRELDAMQSAAITSKNEAASTQARQDEFDRRLSAMEGARIKDRQAIVDQLSGKISDIMGGGSAGKSTSKSKPATAKTGAGSMTGYEHVVKEGDTLSAIAAAYKIKFSAIVEANNLQSPYTLRAGQKLFIPKP